jgi:2-polyprenyl-3-methyl-5-hydroxy-6-metoxy-1,4-benzoquinol methylase
LHKVSANNHLTGKDYDYSLYYRNWHDETDEHFRLAVRGHTEQLTPLLPDAPSGKALDLGCGMGFAIVALHAMGYAEVSGIDVDATQVDSCVRRGLQVVRVDDSATFLRQRREEYDLVTMLDVLEHVPVTEQIELMRAVYEALKPGGRVVVQVPNANSVLASRWRYNDHTHHGSFTEHSLAFVLLNAGFESVNIPAGTRARRPSMRLWRRDVRSSWWRIWRRWIVRKLWEQVLRAELGSATDTGKISLELNLIGFALKPVERD